MECVRYLRRRFPAVKISVEVEKPGRAGLQELASEADVVFYSKSWAQVANFSGSFSVGWPLLIDYAIGFQGNGFNDPEKFLQKQTVFAPHACVRYLHPVYDTIMLSESLAHCYAARGEQLAPLRWNYQV